MKYFVIGLHSSGKQEVINTLESMGVKCGKIFSNLASPAPDIYGSENYEYYDNLDINNIFENDAYIFMQDVPNLKSAEKCYEGRSKYTFDNNDVFVLSPDQLIAIPPTAINEEICFVWLDNNKMNRTSRYHNEKRLYNFIERDKYERRDISSFVKTIYSFNNSSLLYFANEEPVRVATIIHTLLKYPETFKLFVKNFNN